jgi:hypothetical protein
VWWLNKDKKLPPHGYGPDYLRLTSLETATGLEGRVVFFSAYAKMHDYPLTVHYTAIGVCSPFQGLFGEPGSMT